MKIRTLCALSASFAFGGVIAGAAETHDLSAAQPEKRNAFISLWNESVKQNGVIVSDAGPFAQPQP